MSRKYKNDGSLPFDDYFQIHMAISAIIFFPSSPTFANHVRESHGVGNNLLRETPTPHFEQCMASEYYSHRKIIHDMADINWPERL